MATYKPIVTDFSGGLMSPHLRGRIDLDKYAKGAQKMNNFLPTIQGSAHYREGFEWITECPTGNIQLIDFSINNENRYLLVLSAHQIRVYDAFTRSLLYTRGDGTGASVVPYTDEQIPDVRFTKEVEEMLFTHPQYPPYSMTANVVFESTPLYASGDGDTGTLSALDAPLASNDGFLLYSGSVGSAGLTPWDFKLIDFTSHPFKKSDTSNTVMRMSLPKEVVRLESDNATDFTFTTNELDGNHAESIHLDANAVYVEYKYNNQWGLGRVLTTTPAETGGAVAPQNPDGLTCYIDPVEKVVNIEDPTVRLAMIIGDATSAPWTDRDGVDDGKYHVRADKLIFETNHIGAWVRVGDERLFTNVCDPTGSPAYNSQDGKVRWGKVIDYRGVEDHPVDFIYGTYAPSEYDAGNVYEIYEWDDSGAILGIQGFDGSGTNPLEDLAFRCIRSGGTWRFAMNVNIYTATALWGTTAIGTTVAGAIVANMSTQRQFDVVEVDEVKTSGTGGNLLVPQGTVSVYDVKTDPDGLASHTTTLTTSKEFFVGTRDNGRFILGRLGGVWVLLKIDTVLLPQKAEATVLSSISYDDITGDMTNNGVFAEFRMGAWYPGNWPAAVSFYEQRRVFAGTEDDPNLVWMSKTGDSYDFRTVEDDGLVLDSTAITYPLGTSSTIIRWLESGPTLVAGTESNEWQLRPNEFSAAITPENIRITQESSIGSIIQGRRIGSSVFFPHISGRTFTEFFFDFQSQQFDTRTTTKLVNTLFDGDPIKQFGYQHNPNATFWIVTESGRLVTLTYRKEDDYYAWAEHSTEGTVDAVTVVPKGDRDTNEDQVWIVATRNGERSLEVLCPTFIDNLSDNYKLSLCFLDSHIRYPQTGVFEGALPIFSVPDRFGDSVATVADGIYLGVLPVVAGTVQLPEGFVPEKYLLMGFIYPGLLQPMPQSWTLEGGNAYGRNKRLVSIAFYLYKSLGLDVGFEDGSLERIRTKEGESQPMGESPRLTTGFTREHLITGSQFAVDDVPIIKQLEPYPLNVVSVLYKIDLND